MLSRRHFVAESGLGKLTVEPAAPGKSLHRIFPTLPLWGVAQ